jgi:hypothetical protein
VQHNVFWTSVSGDKKAGHNLGTWPKGEKRPFTFDKAGVVPLLCNVHPEMAGYLIVSPTPYFAETDDSGNQHPAHLGSEPAPASPHSLRHSRGRTLARSSSLDPPTLSFLLTRESP